MGRFPMLLTVLKRIKKRALSILGTGRGGSLRTARRGKSTAESGIPVPTVGINSDAETESAVLTKRGASSPERSRAG